MLALLLMMQILRHGGGPGTSCQLTHAFFDRESLSGSVYDSLNDGSYSAFGVMSRFSDGQLVMVYRKAKYHVRAGVNGVIVMRTSLDSGRSWTPADTLFQRCGADLRDVAGGVTSGGRLVIFFEAYNADSTRSLALYHTYSDDRGATWSALGTIATASLTVFSPYGPLIPIGSGDLMQGWYGTDGQYYNVYAIFSHDNGATWQNQVSVSSDTTVHCSETAFAYLGGGNIIGLARENRGTMFRQFFSADSGVSWVNQGSTTFDTWKIQSPPCLIPLKGPDGTVAVAAYYVNRSARRLRTVLGFNLQYGPSGWLSETRTDLAAVSDSDAGYPSVVGLPESGTYLGCYYQALTDSSTCLYLFRHANPLAGALIPATPALVSPMDSVGLPRRVSLLWHPSVGSTTYQLQIATDTIFYHLVLNRVVQDTTLQMSDTLKAVATYYWHVSAANAFGASPYSPVAHFKTGIGVGPVIGTGEPPEDFVLCQNYPNPFNPSTNVLFTVTHSGRAVITLFDVIGREDEVVLNSFISAGQHEVTIWARCLPSGVYFYKLQFGSHEMTKKCILIK